MTETSGKLATYQKVQNVLKGHDVITLNDITVVGPRDKLVAGLRRALRPRGDARTPIRVSSTPVDGTFVEDALVYRL